MSNPPANPIQRVTVQAVAKFGDLLSGSDVTEDAFRVGVGAAIAANQQLASAAKENPGSLLQALAECAALRLNPSPALGHFYLVPFKGQIQALPGYRGLLHLALQSGMVEDVFAIEVYRHEAQALKEQGLPLIDRESGEPNVSLDDRLLLDKEPSPDDVVGVIALARVMGRPKPVTHTLTRAEIDKRRKAGHGNTPAWKQWPIEQMRKTALRALLRTGRVPMGRNRELLKQAMEAEETQRPIRATVEQAQVALEDRREADPLPSPEQLKAEALEGLWKLADQVGATADNVEDAAEETFAKPLDELTAQQIEVVAEGLRA